MSFIRAKEIPPRSGNGDGDDGYDSCMLYDIDKTEFIEALKKIKEYKPTKSIKKKVREG